MITANFTDYFSNNAMHFEELIVQLKTHSYVTDEDFKVSRCLIESVDQRKFDEIFDIHYPSQVNSLRVNSTAIARRPGEYVYVIYDVDSYNDLSAIERQLRSDGVLDISLGE